MGEKHAWHARFFDEELFDTSTSLTVDPASIKRARKDHPLMPVVSLVGPKDDDTVPAKGLILAPFHVPELLNDSRFKAEALDYIKGLEATLRGTLTSAYGPSAELRNLIWAGMGGSIEDKYAGLASGLLKEDAVRMWGLDDVNGGTLGFIFKGIAAAEAGETEDEKLKAGLQKTIVVAQALGMTSVEPVFNVQHALAPTFESFGFKVATHFYKVTIPGSLLDQALQPPVQNIQHQPFGQSTCAGRHDYVSHGMLLPVQLCSGSEMTAKYATSLNLSSDDVGRALAIADWMANADKKNKVLLLPPKEWQGHWHGTGSDLEWREVSLWFKQHLEESLGKMPNKLLKLVTTLETPSNTEDQLVLILRLNGHSNCSAEDEQAIRSKGVDVRCLDLVDEQAAECGVCLLPRLWSIFSVIKYRIAELWSLCAVNQPPVEYYKKIVSYMEQLDEGHCRVEELLAEDPTHIISNSSISINFHASALNGSLPADRIAEEVKSLGLRADAAGDVLGCLFRVAAERTKPAQCYGEFIYFGNLTRGPEAKALRDILQEEGAQKLWAQVMGSFADVGKGPGVGHATHAMGKQGQVLTLSIVPEEHEAPVAQSKAYPTGYQLHNAYANVLALAGYDVLGTDENRKLESAQGHPGMVVLMRLRKNDEPTRAALAAVLQRAAEVVQMQAP
eukprot:TRINITY_DN65080_c0_g1_i1.p1 TRINITY_DN65080_c0_g1~~TRINITY_DN65080_c0_g1_i1.p1  ORF type:complete len:674 (-),score=116.14 TRINITY_DN65080_c0_g1_i1:19-2040(-)